MPVRLVSYILISITMIGGGYFYWLNKNTSERNRQNTKNEDVSVEVKTKAVHVLSTNRSFYRKFN
ncbi:hypothetical protein TUMSATVNIG1_12930 [Vibrio nigripulchritudo]|nr:hypothetical protein TUMSATVNIG1_12930 [Vibrio nigripulchritudo]